MTGPTTQAKVRAILAALPGAETVTPADLDRMALDICLRTRLGQVQAIPRLKSTSAKVAREQLETLAIHADALRVHIHGMGKTAWDAVKSADPDGRHLLRIGADLDALVARAVRALEHVPEAAAAKRGAGTKYGATQAAKGAALAFEVITGKRPTVIRADGRAYGPFLVFLGAVFEALGLEASAEAAAERVREKNRAAAG